MANLTIRGIQEAQRVNARHIQSLKLGGDYEEAIRAATMLAHQAAVRKTHVITGALRASHRIDVIDLRGIVYVGPSSTNLRSSSKPSEYGAAEHAKGGGHAFYRRVIDEDGSRIAQTASREFISRFRA